LICPLPGGAPHPHPRSCLVDEARVTGGWPVFSWPLGVRGRGALLPGAVRVAAVAYAAEVGRVVVGWVADVVDFCGWGAVAFGAQCAVGVAAQYAGADAVPSAWEWGGAPFGGGGFACAGG